MPPFIRVGPGPRGYVVRLAPGSFMGHPLIGGLVTLLVVGLLLALAVAAVAVLVRGGGLNAAGHSSPPNRGAGASANDEALRILSQRFARGEIDAGEYVERRDLLKQSA